MFDAERQWHADDAESTDSHCFILFINVITQIYTED